MFYKKLLPVVCCLITIVTQAQQNFSYTPAKPQPGDVITFSYEPAGAIANTMKKVEGAVAQMLPRGILADDISMERNDGKYTGTIKTDSNATFLFLGFMADKQVDNNFNEGYTILLYKNDKPVDGAYSQESNFFQYAGRQVGVDPNPTKALASIEKQISLYPASRKNLLLNLVRLQSSVNKDDAARIIQKEIEGMYKTGLKEESDYATLESLYQMGKLPEQQKFITSLKKQKFPDGEWTVNETLNRFIQISDPQAKKEKLDEILKKIATDDRWKKQSGAIDFYKSEVVSTYIRKKDWENVKKSIEELGITNKSTLAELYNQSAWTMQEQNENLPLAEEFTKLATSYAKELWQHPGPKPNDLTQKQFNDNNKFTYGNFADTYGMVMYRKGDYKKGLPYAKEAALTLNEGQSADLNNTYALLAEKVLSKKQYVADLEKFVEDGKSTSEIKEILKRAYVKDKKSDKGFDEYMTALQKRAYEKLLADLRKSILNEAAPNFALVDLDGKKIDLADLRGKVVVVDFWATWCGPCKASFPGMQKMVTKYKEDANVKFVFVDTWEQVEEKQKNAGEFIAKNKYSFHVLLDNDNKVVTDYKVEGIPTKVVIDKNGKIRFKAVGFDGSDDKLMAELTAMIEIASNENPKAF